VNGSIGKVAIVGGGSAGWLAASYLAARRPELAITLVESPDIPTIGVGEGTWPTMRETLATIGIAEADFLFGCDATFKQGSRFDRWVSGSDDDSYLHPFTIPPAGNANGLISAWKRAAPAMSFAEAMTAQAAVCTRNLAPRQRAMPDYAGAINYAYHLDAGKFAAMLARHATQRLRVNHLRGEVIGAESAENGDIAALLLRDGRKLSADLFIDCSGQMALLIDKHMRVEWIDRSHASFNDRALAVQAPVAPESPIASQTIGTAHEAGWIWDIGLTTRRGIGCVYSSSFASDDAAAAILRKYLRANLPECDLESLQPRRIAFRTGHRAQFWKGNCIAIGLSAGFIEPLEASAIVMIELSARLLADAFPADRKVMDIHARRFNELFLYRWERILEFLKLHYVLSRRNEEYWRAQRDTATLPARLADNLALWRDHPPALRDFPDIEEIFPAASYQYVLYGMGFPSPANASSPDAQMEARIGEIRDRSRALASSLPTNRAYFSGAAASNENKRRSD
jgi:glycine/D-amino acid oxidase-like deaminating enzyme